MENEFKPAPRRQHIWPWFLLAAFVLAVALACVWVFKEVQRVKHIKASTQQYYGRSWTNPVPAGSPR
jgi:hypothetical protein